MNSHRLVVACEILPDPTYKWVLLYMYIPASVAKTKPYLSIYFFWRGVLMIKI